MTIKMVWEHLSIVLISVILTVAAGVPLGVCACLNKGVRKVILSVVEILQKIHALALLGVIIVGVGAGKVTVVLGWLRY